MSPIEKDASFLKSLRRARTELQRLIGTTKGPHDERWQQLRRLDDEISLTARRVRLGRLARLYGKTRGQAA